MAIEPLHNVAEAAKILGVSEKTLMEHVQHGRIRCILLGAGKTRKHRRFTDKNIHTFIENQKHREVAPCQSISLPKAHTITTISKSTVVAFSALQKSKPKKLPKLSSAK